MTVYKMTPGYFGDCQLAACNPCQYSLQRGLMGDEQPGALAKVTGWLWTERTTFEKGAVIVGGAALVGLLACALAGGPSPSYQPNLRGAARGRSIKVGRKRYVAGKIIEVKGARRFGHRLPPKKYRDQGARRPADYAWPAGYKYPLVFRTASGRIKPALSRKRIRAAARYFGKSKHLYPPQVRRTIARNINAAKRRFGIGGTPASA